MHCSGHPWGSPRFNKISSSIARVYSSSSSLPPMRNTFLPSSVSFVQIPTTAKHDKNVVQKLLFCRKSFFEYHTYLSCLDNLQVDMFSLEHMLVKCTTKRQMHYRATFDLLYFSYLQICYRKRPADSGSAINTWNMTHIKSKTQQEKSTSR